MRRPRGQRRRPNPRSRPTPRPLSRRRPRLFRGRSSRRPCRHRCPSTDTCSPVSRRQSRPRRRRLLVRPLRRTMDPRILRGRRLGRIRAPPLGRPCLGPTSGPGRRRAHLRRTMRPCRLRARRRRTMAPRLLTSPCPLYHTRGPRRLRARHLLPTSEPRPLTPRRPLRAIHLPCPMQDRPCRTSGLLLRCIPCSLPCHGLACGLRPDRRLGPRRWPRRRRCGPPLRQRRPSRWPGPCRMHRPRRPLRCRGPCPNRGHGSHSRPWCGRPR